MVCSIVLHCVQEFMKKAKAITVISSGSCWLKGFEGPKERETIAGTVFQHLCAKVQIGDKKLKASRVQEDCQGLSMH